MALEESLIRLLENEIKRVGGGYLQVEALEDQKSCRLLIHEGTELNSSAPGKVDWHAWEDPLSKDSLLVVLRSWPTFEGSPLDARLGIWYNRYQRQRNRNTGRIRWKAKEGSESYYPYLFPWHELKQLAGESN